MPPPMRDASMPGEITAEALAWLDRVGVAEPMNEQLTSVADATVMRKAIRRSLSVLSALDITPLLKRQGIFARLTGADLEARMRLELSAQQVSQCFADLELAAGRTRQLLEAVTCERLRLGEDLPELGAAIEGATVLLANREGADAELVARFERRLANLMALHTANTIAVQQFAIVEKGLGAMLDRYTDIATVVIPLWRQHLFAMLHSKTKLHGGDHDVASFYVCQSALEEYFRGEIHQ